MKRTAWHYTLAASALALAFAACTVESSDDDGKAGSGGATGGSGGSETGGTGGTETGGTGGVAGEGGAAGEGGTAGGGGTGGGEIDCAEVFKGNSEECTECLVDNCCDPYKTCYADAECLESLQCFYENCYEAEDYDACKAECDGGNFNVAYNELFICLEDTCEVACTVE